MPAMERSIIQNAATAKSKIFYMDQYALYIFLYKIIVTLSALLIILLGYKLFVKGVFDKAGDVEATWKDKKLLIRKAAPGTFFVLFGACVLAISTYRGLQFDSASYKQAGGPAVTSSDVRPVLTDSLKIK